MKLPKLITGTIEDIWLLYININNAFFNFYLFIKEVIKFYPNKTLRKIDIELFKMYLIRDQFTVAQEESPDAFEDNEEESTYGEAVWISMYKIMEFINPSPEKVFYDLGCGTGRICFFINEYYKLNTIGVELIPTFYENAVKISNKFNLKNISFLKSNWLNIDISNGDIIFIAGTCLEYETIEKLISKLQTLKKGSIIISVSNFLKNDSFELLKVMKLPFSWGRAQVFILKKK